MLIIAKPSAKTQPTSEARSINLNAGLSIQGFKVLLIDIDPQCNSTRVFIHPDEETSIEKSLYNTILIFAPLSSIIQKTRFNNLSFVPSHIQLSSAALGSAVHDPFMVMSFMALEVIPSLKLTGQGLVDVEQFKPVPLFVEDFGKTK
jgi:chromosome partitioning protein